MGLMQSGGGLKMRKVFSVYCTADDNYVLPSIIALESVRRFHPECDYFVLGNRNLIRQEKLEILQKFDIKFLHSDRNELFPSDFWPNTIYLKLFGPEILLREGYEYSLGLDADTLCVRPLEMKAIFEKTEGYSGIENQAPRSGNFVEPEFIKEQFALTDADMYSHNTNTGVVFWNNKAVVEKKLAQRAVEAYRICTGKKARILAGDQGLLALISVTEPRIPFNIIHYRYNYRVGNEKDLNLSPNGVRIFHYTDPKPWDCCRSRVHKDSFTRTKVIHLCKYWQQFVVQHKFFRKDDTLLKWLSTCDKGETAFTQGDNTDSVQSVAKGSFLPGPLGEAAGDFEKRYSNLIDLGLFFRGVDDYVILKLSDDFPNYSDYSDIDILCRNRDQFLTHILKVGQKYEEQGFRIETSSKNGHLHIDFYPPNAEKLNFRFDLLDTLSIYENIIVGKHYTEVVLDNKEKINRNGTVVSVPSLEHDLAIRFLEFVEHKDKRPDKIKHWRYIQKLNNFDFINVVKRYTNLKISVDVSDGKTNLNVSKKSAESTTDSGIKRQRKFYNLSPTCQIPGLDAIYEQYFGRQTDGCFVEVGAFDGEYASNTSGLADIGWTGYYIEPVLEYFQRCKARHSRNKNITMSQCAIGAESGEVQVHIGGPLSTIRDDMKRNFESLEWARGSFSKDKKIQAKQLKLDDYLLRQGVKPNFELLVVDVEGYEWSVFRNFDIEKWRPQMVIVELHDQNDDYLLIRQDCKNIVRYFDDHNYKAVYKDSTNTVYVLNYSPVAKTRIDYFMIWGHGLQYTQQILNIIRSVKDFNIISIVKKSIDDINKFVQDIYSCDTVPFEHLVAKTRYLLSTRPEVVFILLKNNNPQEKLFGEGEFRHVQCRLVKDVKEEIRNKFNPRINGKRTEHHVIHASDYEGQVEHVLKVLGLPPIEFYTREPNPDLDVPFHIGTFDDYQIKEVNIDGLYANILGVGVIPIVETPHYKYLTGDKAAYQIYHEKYFGKQLTEDHFPEAYDSMIANFKYDYTTKDGKRSLILAKALGDDKYQILDGVHRAAILKHQGIKTITIAEPVLEKKQYSLVGLIFSKDRAMQLQATIESFKWHCKDSIYADLTVLYKVSNPLHRHQYDSLKTEFADVNFVEEVNFREQLLSIIEKYNYVLFLVDDNIFVRDFCLADIVRSLDDNTAALGFSLRLGKNTNYCYMLSSQQALPQFREIGKGVLKYYWPDAQYDFGYPLEVSSSVYRCRDILQLLSRLEFTNPNRLESQMNLNKYLYHRLPYLLTFEESVTFCNPVNVVQDVYENKHGMVNRYTSEELAECFSRGIAVDVEKYVGFTPHAAHQEMELHFTQAPLHNLPQLTAQDDSKPLVTVYTVTYNTERYIRYAIESVLAQDYPNIEYLIIDDGSTDNTRAIVSSYKDSRITYVYREHKNFASGMNEAIHKAKGTFILGVDADDYIDPCYVRHMVEFAMKNPDHDYYYPQVMVHVNEHNQLRPTSYRYRDYSDSREILHLVFRNGYGVVPNPGSLKRRFLYDKTGLYREVVNVEDFAYLTEHALSIRYKLVPDNPLYYYRCVEGHGNTLQYDTKHRIIAESMYKMVMENDSLIFYPELQRIADSMERQKEFFRLAAETMERHAEHHRERYGLHFKEYADKIRERLKDINASEHRVSVGTVSCVPNRRLRIAILPHRNNISFMGEILTRIQASHDVWIVECNDQKGISGALMSADVCWIEWATDFAVRVTQLPRRCRTILRLHSFEAFCSFPQEIHWENVDDLILVDPYIREVLKNQVSDIEAKVRTHVVPNCVDMDRFYFKDKPRGKRIAFVGALRPVKNIPFLMQCFREIHAADPEYTLHVAGELFGTELHRNELYYYIKHIEKELGIHGHISFCGYVQDVSSWLDDKDFILSTSIREGQPVNIIEGMAKGLKPVVHNFPGAKHFYPHKWIFDTAQECRDIVLSPDFDRHAYLAHVKEHWSAEKVLPQIDELLTYLAANRYEKRTSATVGTETTLSRVETPMRGSGPKVSVVTACYNAEEFLPECFESIRNQTMQEWELFLLDDASTDGTKSIIEKYSRMDERIRPYYFHDNKGSYVRRNFAIERAKSDFIVIQDADDIMCPAKLETLYNEITTDERLGIVGSFYHSFLDEFKGLQYAEEQQFPLEHDEIIGKLGKWQAGICHGSAIIRKELFESIGPYDENPFGADSFWLAKVVEYARCTADVKLKNIPEFLMLRRMHSGSQTQIIPTDNLHSRRKLYKQYCEGKLKKVRQKLKDSPRTDIKTELKNCKCLDFIEKYGHLFAQWENRPLDSHTLLVQVGWSVKLFNSRRYVSCISRLNSMETIDRDIAKRYKNYDLLRAMAYYAIDRKEESLRYLNSEIQNHNSAAARQFISDYFERQLKTDVQSWCCENAGLYELRMIDTGGEQGDRVSVAPLSRSRPKVSIILSCYNSEKFLPECIDSIRNQTMQDWELLVLDDASTDGTKSTIEKYSRMDERIKAYYFQDNKGPYVRRNFAIERANSDFIVIQDADDIMCPAKLETLYNEITRDKQLGIVGSSYQTFLDEFRGLEYIDSHDLLLEHNEIAAKFSNFRHGMSHGSAIIRKDLFEAIGLYDENPFAADTFWFAKAAEYAKHCPDTKFKNVPEYLTLIRIHDNSQTQLLPTLDPRNKRALYRQYCNEKLGKVIQKLKELPHADIKTELKNCNCSDFIEKYGHLSAQWEDVPLAPDAFDGRLGRAVWSFNERNHITCITRLNSLEKVEPNIAKRFKNYDLLRAMAYFAIDRKKQSLTYLNREIENHNNPAARKFISDYFEGPDFAETVQKVNSEKRLKIDIQSWCLENDKFYDLRIIDLENERDTQQEKRAVCRQNVPAPQGEQGHSCPTSSSGQTGPLVSIIMPVYNMPDYVAEAIGSVLTQGYRNFELIVVDDGSTDNTKDIILGFKDERIKYFYKENGGPYSARNLGMKKAGGDFIVPLDADDMITPDYIARHLQEFERCPDADLIYCDDYLIEEDCKPIRVIERREYTDRKLLIRDLFRCGFPIVPFRTCIRKSVFDRIGLFDDGFRNAMDYDMIRRFVKHGLKAHHLKAPLYLRRMTPDSVSRKVSDEKVRAHFEVLRRFTESFSYDELFPDVAWDKIAPEMRQLHAKCLAAMTYLAIGQTYVKTNSPIYARTAFGKACSELRDSLKMDPGNTRIRQLLQKCEFGRQRYDEQIQQTVR